MNESLQSLVSAKTKQEIDHWIAKYPVDQRQSAVMRALMVVQEEKGYLDDTHITAIADYLDMPTIAVYEVVTFYSMYKLKPEGKHCLEVCTNISCKLRGAEDVVSLIGEKLGIEPGETTEDGRFHLKTVECLGACCGAPMMQIGKQYYENLTPQKIDAILDECK